MTRFHMPCVVLLLACGLSGCRSLSKNGESASNNRDPLYGRYIPKQDLPIPGRDSAGKERDPLLGLPASNPKSASNSEPFRNSKATSVAGLAGNVKVEDSGMSLGDRRPKAEPATRGVPLKPSGQPAAIPGESWNQYAEELNRLKARYDTPVREANGDYSIRASVPVGSNGAMRRYEGVGPSAAAAAKQLLDQIKND